MRALRDRLFREPTFTGPQPVTHTDDDNALAPVAPPRRSFGRKLLGFGKALLVLLGVLFVAFYALRWQAGRMGQRKLDVGLAALDAREPGWRLNDRLAARERAQPAPPDNDGPRVLAIADKLPKDWSAWANGDAGQKWHAKRDPNRLPPADATAAARAALEPLAGPRAEALGLRDSRGAFFPVKVENNPMATLLPHCQKCREVVSLLGLDGQVAALDQNPARGIDAARAQLKLARAIGDEPFFISQLVRMACAAAAAQTAMQVLAWAEPPAPGLAELQAELLAEAEFPHFLTGMRGERAALDRVFEGLAEGTITEDEFFQMATGRVGPAQRALFRAYKGLIPADRAKCLELCTQYIEAAQLPHHERLAAIAAVPHPKRDGFDPRYLGTMVLMPAVGSFAESGLRTRANLLSAAAGVACERFRLKHGRFPDALAELVPEFLPSVPVNPFDGKPLTFRALGDRVAIYGWHDDSRFAREAPPADFDEGPRKGQAHGFRVWLPKSRALPPLADAKPADDDAIPPPREKP